MTDDRGRVRFNKYDIVTNPPYAQAKEFVMHAMNNLDFGGKAAFFLKLTFLEGKKRKDLFDTYPPKVIHVFRGRTCCAKNGNEKEFKKSSAICYAWFVFEKGFNRKPTIDWIE